VRARYRRDPQARTPGQPRDRSSAARLATVLARRAARWVRRGYWATVPLVEMGPYLAYLVRRLADAGGQIRYEEVHSLNDLSQQAPLLANCAGLGARELVPDPTVRPAAALEDVPVLRDDATPSRRGWRCSPSTPTWRRWRWRQTSRVRGLSGLGTGRRHQTQHQPNLVGMKPRW